MTRIIAGIYGVLCLLSLVLMAIGSFGWFGQEKDPLSAVFALLLAMPWPTVTGIFDGPVVGLVILLAGMGINLAIIMALGKFISSRSAGNVYQVNTSRRAL